MESPNGTAQGDLFGKGGPMETTKRGTDPDLAGPKFFDRGSKGAPQKGAERGGAAPSATRSERTLQGGSRKGCEKLNNGKKKKK